MGVGWSALSPIDVETGALERNGAKMLILPMCAALSDAACDSIRRWVGLGGKLIADLLPATFTAHGRLRGASISPTGMLQSSTNPLDALFGVTPGARPSISNDTVAVGGGVPFPVRCVDEALATTATAQSDGITGSGSVVWFENTYLQGQAAYLGCSFFSDYTWSSLYALDAPGRRGDRLRMEEAFAALLRSLNVVPRVEIAHVTEAPVGPWQLVKRAFFTLLRRFGVLAQTDVVDVTGGRVGLCQFYARSFGATELIVMLRDYEGIFNPVEPEANGEIRFSSSAHTYDLDNGTYLGFGDRLKLRINAYTFRAFARLPYRVTRVDIQVAGSPRLGDTITATAVLFTEQEQPQAHRFRLDALDATGRPLRYLASEAIGERGTATFSIPTALNDPPGVWTIVVTDVATGIQGRILVDLGFGPFEGPLPQPFEADAIDD